MPRPLLAVLLGGAAGFFSGLFGIGGGLVMVPAMVLWLSVSQHRAHATSMAAIIVISAAAVTPFASSGEVEWLKAGWLTLGAVAGAYVGARALARIPEVWLARAFVVLAAVAAVRLGLGS